MTDNQKKLMPYVEARTESIITQKQEREIVPLLVTEPEIIAEIRTDVLECMRELNRSGKYLSTDTLNHPALKKIEK